MVKEILDVADKPAMLNVPDVFLIKQNKKTVKLRVAET